jgi:NAD(P)-dependent dehydrogenase (short-subunit alcohol dehydrogenase family)
MMMLLLTAANGEPWIMTDERHAVIIGYGSGIAAAAADAFGREGHALTLIARDRTKVQAGAAELASRGFKSIGLVADAGDPQELSAALGEARLRQGHPTALIYNAAAWRAGPVLGLTDTELVADFRVCVAGALMAARTVAGPMRAQRQGSILFTGGGLALHPSRHAPSLSIGKAGLRLLALMLAEELAPDGVKVGTVTIAGTVAPGTSLSPERVAKALLDLHRDRTDFTRAEIVLQP